MKRLVLGAIGIAGGAAVFSPDAHLRLGALFVLLTAAPAILYLNQKGQLFP